MRARLLVASTLLLVLFGADRLDAQERDLWYLLIAQDEAVGSVHVVVEPTEDGAVRMAWDTRIPIDFMGQDQEMRVTTELLMTEDLRPLSMTSVTTGMSGSSMIEGELVGTTLSITSDDGDEASTVESTVDESLPLIFESCLGPWLASRSGERASLRVQVIDDGAWQLDTLEILALTSADGRTRRWRVERELGERLTIEVGADGHDTERDYTDAGMKMVRCTPEEAASIRPIEQTGRTVLNFPVDRPLPDLDAVTALTVELRWKDIPIDEFDLTDDRQQLVEHVEDDEGHRAVVTIASPPPLPPEPSDARSEELALYLAETQYIRPRDEGIRSIARRVTADQPDGLASVLALSEWVHGAIEGTLIAETLSGPEVLERGIGKCTEYSTLFASLARSAGIPTRVALGERLVGDSWGGHMWNEVYLGRWISVDATVNEVGDSKALLKFVHSDTVAGTQPLRWALTESLDIRIQDVQVADGVEVVVTGLAGGTYTDVARDYRIRAPREAWVVHDLSEADAVTLRFEIPGADAALIHFAAFELPPGADATTLARSRIEALFRPQYDELDLLREHGVTLAGGAGLRSDLTGVPRGSDAVTRSTEVVWARASNGYILNLVAPEALYAEHLAAFEELLASFEAL